MFSKKLKIFFSLLGISTIVIIGSILQKDKPLPLSENPPTTFSNSTSTKNKITIFVHGTIFNYPSYKILKKTLNDKNKSKGFLDRYVNKLRYSGIYKCQPINEHGLIPINFGSKDKKTKISKLLSRIYKQNYLNQKDKKNLNLHFYTFGWDGKLSSKKRKEAGFKFYEELTKEIEKLKTEKNLSNIEIDILAHSHGGNVALYLPEAEKELKKNLKIKNLILFGTPVQTETKDYVKSDLFKNVYNIYSRGDSIQVLDFVSTKSAHSKRRFADSENLVQLEIMVDSYQPLHNELWLMGKKSNLIYRKKFPLYPFPLMVLCPIITKFIKKNIENPKNLDLKILTQDDNLKFIFSDPKEKIVPIKKNTQNKQSSKPKYCCLLKNFNELKRQI